MNDNELLQLIREGSIEDLSADQIELIRSRLRECPELRQELAHHLRLESGLAATLGRFEISVDEILSRPPVPASKRWRFAFLLTSGLLILVVAAIGWFVRKDFLQRTQIVQANPDANTSPLRRESPAPTITPASDSKLDKVAAPPDDKMSTAPAGDTSREGSKKAVEDRATSDSSDSAPNQLISLKTPAFDRGNLETAELTMDDETFTYLRGDSKSRPKGGMYFVEYDLDLPQGGIFEVRLHFIDGESTYVTVVVNGDKLTREKMQKMHPPKHQAIGEWRSAGNFTFVAGKNVLRLEKTSGSFPRIDALEIEYSGTLHDPEKPVVAVAPPPEPAPWQAVLDAEKLPRFADICFDTFDISKALPARDQIMKWIEPVVGYPGKIVELRKTLGSLTTFEGTFRLRAPLTEDTALRLSLEDYSKIQLHVFHGEYGVTLSYYEEDSFRWAAFAMRREAGTPNPLGGSVTLTATDDGRGRRSELRQGGPFEIRYRDGEIILSRGDIVLLRAPLAGPPDDIFLQGKATFYGIALVRTSDQPFAKAEPAPGEVAQEVLQPADLNWHESLASDGQLARLPDGAVQFIGEKSKSRSYAVFPLPEPSLREIILQLEDLAPGVSLVVGGTNLNELQFLRLVRVEKSDYRVMEPHSGENTKSGNYISSHAIASKVHALVGKDVWLRLVWGTGVIRWWTSSDGIHWGESGGTLPLPAIRTHIGLHHLGDNPGVQATLRKVIYRPLPALDGLVDPSLFARAIVASEQKTVEGWEQRVHDSRPADVEAELWRRACLLRTLAAGCTDKIGMPLIASLMDEIVDSSRSLSEKFQVFNECLKLVDSNDNRVTMGALGERYHDAAWNEYEQHGGRPFTATRQAIISAPFGHRQSVSVGDPRAIRLELLQLMYAEDWSAAYALCRQLRYFGLMAATKLFDWAELSARRELPSRETGDLNASVNPRERRTRRSQTRGDSLARQRANWSSPLIEELSKETYNSLAELQALLDSDAYDDSARMVANFDPNVVAGVAPTVIDERLLVSLPAAIRLAIDMNPRLRTAIEQQFGQLAQLRVRQAIAVGNSSAVELATVQFPTTEAAAEAHRWLGDRALSSGRFIQALAAYRQGLSTAGSALKAELHARERFAAAMIGQDVGAPVAHNVVLGQQSFTPAEFEDVVHHLRQQSQAANGNAASSHARSPVPTAPPPTSWDVHVRVKLDDRLGDAPGEEIARELNRSQADWAGRQIATALEGDTLFLSNRFQLAAYDLAKNGERIWQSRLPAAKSRKSREWTLIPMRPLVLPYQIVARQAYGDGLTLVSVDKKNGDQRWEVEAPREHEFASDPTFAVDKLFVFLMSKPDPQGSILRLATLDPETGEMLTQSDILRLGPVWQIRHCCEVLTLDDALVATLGGVVVCCDFNGNVRWIRKQVSLPPDEETEWVHQYFDPPLLHANKLLVAQPGVRSLEYIDPTTGRLIWQTFIPNIRRLLGVIDDRAIVMTDEGIEAYALASGTRLWRHLTSDITTAQFCGGAGGLAYIRTERLKGDEPIMMPRMIWLDPGTGNVVANSPIKKPKAPELRFGPAIVAQEKIWAFSGAGVQEPIRSLVELNPTSDAERP